MLIVARYVFVWTTKPNQPHFSAGSYKVIDVVDAFQLVLQPTDLSEQYLVRILGVKSISDDTMLRKKAHDFINTLCRNRIVRVELDRRRIDEDQMLLAHIYVDGRLLSADLVRHRFAKKSILESDSKVVTKKLVEAEEQAATRISSS